MGMKILMDTYISMKGGEARNVKLLNPATFYEVLQTGNNELRLQFVEADDGKTSEIKFYYMKRFSIISSFYEYYYYEGRPLSRLLTFNMENIFLTYFLFSKGQQPGLISDGKHSLNSHRLRFTGTQKSAEKIVKAIMDDHENIVMPRIRELSDIHEFNKYMNDPWDKFLWDGKYHGVNNIFFVKLISSALAGDGNLEKIYNKMMPVLYDKAFGKYGEEYKVFHYHLLEKVYERLQNTPPLTDPNLDNYNITEPIIYDGLV